MTISAGFLKNEVQGGREISRQVDKDGNRDWKCRRRVGGVAGTPAVTPNLIKAVSNKCLSRNLKFQGPSKLWDIYIRCKRVILYVQILGNGNICR